MEKNLDYTYRTPNDLHLIVHNPYELVILQYLIQLSSGCSKIYPSEQTLRLGIMSRDSVKKSIDALKEQNLISVKFMGYPNANEYTVNLDVIRHEILSRYSNKELSDKDKKVYSEAQKQAMAKRTMTKNPELMNDPATINGLVIVDKSNGVIQNG